MSKPVTEVLEILDEAIACVPPEKQAWQDHEFSADIHLMELDFWEDKPLGERVGVSQSIFPPPEELEEDELKVLTEKMLELWACYNYFAEPLEGKPYRLAYTKLLSVWNEGVPSVSVGRFHFDFYDDEELHPTDDLLPF